ncbi:hypothetical protein OSTOST_11537 [Ostertagia ostertagi]
MEDYKRIISGVDLKCSVTAKTSVRHFLFIEELSKSYSFIFYVYQSSPYKIILQAGSFSGFDKRAFDSLAGSGFSGFDKRAFDTLSGFGMTPFNKRAFDSLAGSGFTGFDKRSPIGLNGGYFHPLQRRTREPDSPPSSPFS